MSSADMNRRKERAQQLVKAYYDQLAVGCGSQRCTNEYCRSSPQFRSLSQSDLPKLAVDLAKRRATLCKAVTDEADKIQEKDPPTQQAVSEAMDTTDSMATGSSELQASACSSDNATAASADGIVVTTIPVEESSRFESAAAPAAMDVVEDCSGEAEESAKEVPVLAEVTNFQPILEAAVEPMESTSAAECPLNIQPLDLDEVLTLVTVFEESGEDGMLHERLQDAFSSWQVLSACFPASSRTHLSSPMTQGETSHQPMDIVDDRDDDTATEPSVTVDIDRLRQAYARLSDIDAQSSVTAIIAEAVDKMMRDIRMLDHKIVDQTPSLSPQCFLNLAVILLEMPWLQDPFFLESIMSHIVQYCASLPKGYRFALARCFSRYSPDALLRLVTSIQQFLAFHIVVLDVEDGTLKPDDQIQGAVITMEVLFAASVLGSQDRRQPLATGMVESAAASNAGAESKFAAPRTMAAYLTLAADERKEAEGAPRLQSLMPHLKEEVLRCKSPLMPLTSFVSEPLNAALNLQHDYINFQYYTHSFSVMRYPFLMSVDVKSQMLMMDCRVRQRVERRTIVQIGNMLVVSPFLKIQVRRDNIIMDTLTRLEIAAADDPDSFQKQLYIEFEGEQGIDEGGVQKEFFQILIEQLFNADFGMFTYDEDTRLFWFNPSPLDNEAHFTLIGMLFGLALYNNVILDVHFPMVVYRKLMGVDGDFDDLTESHPVVARSLTQMLEYDGDDFEDVFGCTFCVGYESIFGEQLSHELKPDGKEIPVTKQNRQEYVNQYTDFILNKMIATQFDAFKKGFTTVTHKSNLSDWFLADDLEVLVCGRKELDFEAMEASTEYDGGFKVDTPLIVQFWEIVHNFTEQQKRQLLTFCTGSDRVPVGGLKQLGFVIVRNGPDSPRLPTAHTCFNTLLLPHYSSRDVLEERLLKAISHAKGFGMV